MKFFTIIFKKYKKVLYKIRSPYTFSCIHGSFENPGCNLTSFDRFETLEQVQCELNNLKAHYDWLRQTDPFASAKVVIRKIRILRGDKLIYCATV